MVRIRYKKGTRPPDKPTARQKARAQETKLARVIKEETGITMAKAREVLKAIATDPETRRELELFREHEADILDHLRREILSGWIADGPKRGTVDYGILVDKTRLLRGESTQNVANLTILATAADALELNRVRKAKAEPVVEVEPVENKEKVDAEPLPDLQGAGPRGSSVDGDPCP